MKLLMNFLSKIFEVTKLTLGSATVMVHLALSTVAAMSAGTRLDISLNFPSLVLPRPYMYAWEMTASSHRACAPLKIINPF